MREIEKIGLMLRKLLEMITRKEKHSEATVDEAGMEEVSGWLQEESGCDLGEILALEGPELAGYLSGLQGFNCPNIELLGDLLMTMGMKSAGGGSEDYLAGALRLYELCDHMDRSFSLERDGKIREIRDNLA